jgi:hypothetical protein
VTSAAGRFRLAALLAAGALAVHELRYALAYGDHAGSEASAQGHAYLTVLAPVVVLAALFASAQALLRFAGGPASGNRRRRFTRLWLGCAVALAAAYCGQELIEGCLAAGHPAGVPGVLEHGGWIALACAPVVGGLVALAVRGAAAASEPRASAAGWRPRPAAASAVASPPPVFQPSPDPVARFLAGRGPPLTSV